jgi:DNA-binding protein HU-beta
MTKTEIVAKVAEEAEITKAAAAKALAVTIGAITEALSKGTRVAFAGFGTFSVAERRARKGRNPRTGKEIKIAARKVPKFSAGACLKAAAAGEAVGAKPEAKKAVAKPKKK